MGLICLGSMGYIVIIEIYEFLFKKIRKLSINSKISLIMTAVLILMGALFSFYLNIIMLL